jgi:Enoyl-(Acyl carrier protein) reductase
MWGCIAGGLTLSSQQKPEREGTQCWTWASRDGARSSAPRAWGPGRLRRGVARSVAHAGVTVQQRVPGFFDSDRYRAGIDATAKVQGKPREQFAKKREAMAPMKRIGDPQELGDACAFLCSARAGYITGQNLLLDFPAFRSTGAAATFRRPGR